MDLAKNRTSKRLWTHPENGKYYIAYVDIDLLGDFVVITLWGGKGRRPSRMKYTYVPSLEASISMLEHLHKTRINHGYHLSEEDF